MMLILLIAGQLKRNKITKIGNCLYCLYCSYHQNTLTKTTKYQIPAHVYLLIIGSHYAAIFVIIIKYLIEKHD